MKMPVYKSTSCKLKFTKHENCDLHIVSINLHVPVNFQLFQYCALKRKTWLSCIIWGNVRGGIGLEEYNELYHDKLWVTDCVIHFRVEIFFFFTNFEIVTYCFHTITTISTLCRGETSIAFTWAKILKQLTNNEVEWKEVKCEFAAGAG